MRWRTYVFSGTGCGEKSEWVRVSAFGGVRDGRVSGGPRARRGVVSNDAPPRAIVFSSGAKDGERREFFLSRRSSRTGHIFFCTSRDRRRASLARILIPRAAVPRGWGERSPAPRRSPRLKKKDKKTTKKLRFSRRLPNAASGCFEVRVESSTLNCLYVTFVRQQID
jgi:hypothetical protein